MDKYQTGDIVSGYGRQHDAHVQAWIAYLRSLGRQ
jgi:hypothetical protein